jgi:hypothetical protein
VAARRKSAPARALLACRRAEPCGGDNRTETYGTRAPNGEPLTVARCLDCGAQSVSVTTTLAAPPPEQPEQPEPAGPGDDDTAPEATP